MPAKRILIADDAIDFARMLQASLGTLDPALKVTLVPSAEEALLETSRVSPDLLVADMRLPGMSGLDLLRKVRARYPSVRVIAVTGVKEPGLEEKFIQAGADCFFVKPLVMDDFLRAAGELLAAQPRRGVTGTLTPPTQPRRGVTGTLTPPAQPARSGSSGGTGRLRVRVTVERAAELVAALRQTLNARMVLLTDARGQILTRAGEHDAVFEADGVPAALAALNSSRKLGHMAGDNAQTALVFKGKEMEIVVAPVGEQALIIGLRSGRTQLRLTLAFEETLAFQKECGGVILNPAVPPAVQSAAAPPVKKPNPPPQAPPTPPAARPVPLEPAKPEKPATPPEEDNTPADLGDLEKLFRQPLSNARVDVNAFWEQALDSTGDRVASPDVISYEQARQMGLNPENNNGHL